MMAFFFQFIVGIQTLKELRNRIFVAATEIDFNNF